MEHIDIENRNVHVSIRNEICKEKIDETYDLSPEYISAITIKTAGKKVKIIGGKVVIYKKIITEVGCIEAKRNAIYLDSFQQQGNKLMLLGEISAKWCEKKVPEYKWYKYCLNITGVKEYNAINIEDYYKRVIETESTFSEMVDESENEKNFRTIILETYDWAYIIVCKDFVFEIIDRR